ncbi:MAG: D-alanine--D-alanine ligase [Solobacterium sp.]|nr:D-alanine--D-alanine ligase [Solobacterium sp.]MBQ1447009.1 D-alanine--D-alanine ligase [Solobacterium sp.]MBQ6592047.1 D-alanine--D-alanine ligase [Solobacterium sp.]MBR0478051.1 D-alanine--D-alanine ligase [Solobacterium sp.]MBR2727155.1 D-alanine--D-alanine ligase [Solobacterium sp.]
MKLNIAVIFGSETVEHEVSVISAHQAMEALDPEKYNVLPVYISKDRKFYHSDALRSMDAYKDLSKIPAIAPQVTFAVIDNRTYIMPVKSGLFAKKPLAVIDAAIPVMHGTYGEDGMIAGLMEAFRLPYSSCDIIAAGVGQDKVLQKHILSDNGLPLTRWFWVYADEIDTNREEVLRKVHKLIYPVILKPARTGSSIGISIAHNDEEYLECFEDARQYDEKIITEKVVKPMREINCSVLGDGNHARTSALEEVSHGDSGLLDYKDKYLGTGSTKGAKNGPSKGMASASRIVPAPLDKAQEEYIKDLALRTFRVLGCAGVCRIDFLMDAETKTVYVNEINTIPGSLSFYLWNAAGESFPALMDELVNIALERERRRSHMNFSFDSNLLASYSAQGTKGSKGAKKI